MHACKVPKSQCHWPKPKLRGTQPTALVLESNTLWVKFHLCHFLALEPKRSCILLLLFPAQVMYLHLEKGDPSNEFISCDPGQWSGSVTWSIDHDGPLVSISDGYFGVGNTQNMAHSVENWPRHYESGCLSDKNKLYPMQSGDIRTRRCYTDRQDSQHQLSGLDSC